HAADERVAGLQGLNLGRLQDGVDACLNEQRRAAQGGGQLQCALLTDAGQVPEEGLDVVTPHDTAALLLEEAAQLAVDHVLRQAAALHDAQLVRLGVCPALEGMR